MMARYESYLGKNLTVSRIVVTNQTVQINSYG
jgi:hypothetical protein